MVLETWISWMGNHVSSTFKTAVKKASFDSRKWKSKSKPEKAVIGVLAFEVANLMSKAVQLWQSLSDQEILRLRTEAITLEGVRKIVSNDEDFLLGLACAEKLDSLTVLAVAVARLGKKCQDPALQGFGHVYEDMICNTIDVRALEFSFKEMEAKVKKMEKYVSATANLYQESEVLADLEQTLRRMQGGDDANRLKDSVHSFQQKVVWQRQETKYLREISLWSRTFDAIVGLLAQTIFTIYGRITSVFGVPRSDLFAGSGDVNRFSAMFDALPRSLSISASMLRPYPSGRREIRFPSGPLERCPIELYSGRRPGSVLNRIGSNKVWQDRDQYTAGILQPLVTENNGSGSPSMLSKECLKPNLNGNRPLKLQKSALVDSSNTIASDCKLAESSCNISLGDCQRLTPAGARSANAFHPVHVSQNVLPQSAHIRLLQPQPCPPHQNSTRDTRSFIGSKCKLLTAPPSTLGGAALALHYANIIIVIEKLLRFPHLIGDDARDDLYQMLPTSLRMALRARLKTYAKNLASMVYDAALAADWNDALGKIMGWLAPLAHNMITWQTEHNFEQQHLVSRTNVLLLQTLYFANQTKTEAAITELLVGLNYICRYEQAVRSDGFMECTSEHDYDEYLQWHL